MYKPSSSEKSKVSLHAWCTMHAYLKCQSMHLPTTSFQTQKNVRLYIRINGLTVCVCVLIRMWFYAYAFVFCSFLCFRQFFLTQICREEAKQKLPQRGRLVLPISLILKIYNSFSVTGFIFIHVF